MPIKVACACGKLLAVKDELAGKKVQCPACQKLLSIPKPKVQAEALDDEWYLGGSAEEDFEDEPSDAPVKSKSSNHGLLIGVAAGGGVLVVALLAWLLWPAAPAADVADNPPASPEQTPTPAMGDTAQASPAGDTTQVNPPSSVNPPANAVGDALKALQGDWHFVDLQQDPPAHPMTLAGLKLATVTFAGDSMTIDHGSAVPGGRKETTTIKLDASQNPKTIDMTAADGPQKGKTNPGIYSLEGDVLKLHFSESRPTTWTPVKGAKAAVMVMNRGRPPLTQQASDKSVKSLSQLAADSPHAAFVNISDGTANTVFGGMVSESRAVPWTKPDDLVFDDSFQTKENSFVEGAVMFADGAIRHLQIQEGLDRAKFRLLFSINDGQPSPLMGLYPPDHKFAPLIYKSVQDQVRQAEARSENKNSLKAMALAFHNYHDVFKHFPPAIVYGPDGKPWHSWRVLILPYLGQKELYDQYDGSVPWDHPKNAAVLNKMPAVFRDPLSDKADSNKTRYLLATGAGTAFPTKPTGNVVAQAPAQPNPAQPAPAKPAAKDGREPIEYQPFNPALWKAKNQSTWLFPWEGERVVLLTTTADLDPKTMTAFVKRLDAAWKLCGELVGQSPNLNKQHNGKVTIAAVPDLSFTLNVGNKFGFGFYGSGGIEVAEFYGPQGDFERFRKDPESFPDHYFLLIGQNHSVALDRVSFATNGSALLLRNICMEGVKYTDSETQARQSVVRYENAFAQSKAIFAESFVYFGAKTPLPLNDIDGKPFAGGDLSLLFASCLLKVRQENGGDEWVKRFYRHLSECPPVVARQANEIASVANGQLLNWVVAASLAAGKDLSPLFRDRWRFPLAPEMWQALKTADWKKSGLTADNVFDALPIEHLHIGVAMTRPGFLTPERRKQNLLVGGTFEGDAASKWKLDSFRANLQSGAMEGSVVKEGQKAAVLRTTINDDTRFTQTVTIKPGTRYLLSGWIKTKDVAIDKVDRSYGRAGATLSIWGGYEHSRSLVGTNDWTYSTLIFDSGNRTEVAVLARLGYWNSTASGEAWFDDLSLIPIGESPVRPVAQSPPPAPGPPAKDNLLVNGSFEEGPDIPENFGYLPNVRAGSTDIKGWTVTRGNIDVVGRRLWSAGHGQRSIDLHGSPGLGGLKQSFKTVVGQRYQVSFLMSGTPQERISLFKLAVRAADKQQEFSFDTTGKTRNQMGWTRKTWDFVAIATETTLEIHTLQTTAPDYGPIIDDVSVIAVEAGKAALPNPQQAEAPLVEIRGKELRRLEGHQGPVWKAMFSADGKRVLSGSGFPNGDSTMRLWDVETGREIRQFRNEGTNWVYGVALSHDGKQALSGNVVGITLWDVETGAVLRRMDFDSTNKKVLSVAFTPDGKRAVSAGSDHVVRLWDLTSGAEIRTLTGHLGRVMSVAFSPDGSQIASCGLDEDKTVRLWNTETGKEMLRLEGHTAGVEGVAFTPDGSRIVSSAFDGLILWDVKAGKLIRKIGGDGTGLLEAVFFPDGRRVLTGGISGRVSIWDSETGQELQRLAEGSEWVWTVAVSPDGLRGVSAGGSGFVNGKWLEGKDFAIRLWSLAGSNSSAKVSVEDVKGTPAKPVQTEKTPASKDSQEPLTLKGHTDLIHGVAFSPDGKLVASASWDRSVKLWDTGSGQEVRTIKSAYGQAMSVAFSPNGERIAVVTPNKLQVWGLAPDQEPLTMEGRSGGNCVAFSPDGRRLAVGDGNKTVKVWDSMSGQEIHTLSGHTARVNSVAFSPDGKLLASAGGYNARSEPVEVKLWDITSGKETLTLKGHVGGVNSVAFARDGKRLASAGDKEVKVWDAANGQETLTIKGFAQCHSITFNPDGTRLASGHGDHSVRVWDATTGQELFTSKGHLGRVRSVAFSPDGKRLASGSDDQTVNVWDASKALPEREGDQVLFTFKGHTSLVTSVAFFPDGKRVASASSDQTVRVWDATNGQELLTLKGEFRMFNSVAISPDGKRLAAASDDNQPVTVWDATNGQELLAVKVTSPVRSVVFSPDGKRLAAAAHDQTVKVWDATSGQELLTLKGHSREVICVRFSPDGNRLASGSYDQSVRVWDAKSGDELKTFANQPETIWAIAFSPDSKRLAAGTSQSTVTVWDVENGREVFALKGDGQWAQSLAFSPDGTRLAAGHSQSQLRIWDLKRSPKPLLLRGHAGHVSSLAFSPDGKRLASASSDKMVKIREIAPQTAAQKANQDAARNWKGWPNDAPAPATAPFDATQAKQHQEAWAKHLGVPVEYTNSIGMKFRLIPPGEFLMGAPSELIEATLKDSTSSAAFQEKLRSQTPRHKVILTQPIYLGIHEVTQGHFETLTGKKPSHFSATGAGSSAVNGIDTTRSPVDSVNWQDVALFCTKLSEREKLKPFDHQNGKPVTQQRDTGYRLPTEAEWEFACRAGTDTLFWPGNSDEELVRGGWFGTNSAKRTHTVGELAANSFGMHDTHGNVWEWVLDAFDLNEYESFENETAIDPTGPAPTDSQRGLRGGSWQYTSRDCWSSFRHSEPASLRHRNIGFRVALSVETVKFALANPVKAEAPPAENQAKEPLTLKGRSEGVYRVAFSPDGTRLTSAMTTPRLF